MASEMTRLPQSRLHLASPPQSRLHIACLSRGRWADADEIAQSICFLASEQSGLITGVTLPVDGGLHFT